MQGTNDSNDLEKFSVQDAIDKLKESKATMLWWFIAVFILGQLGIFMAFLSNKENTFIECFKLNLMLGNFYSFAIACLGGNIFACFHELIFKKEIMYKQKKFIVAGCSLLIILFMIYLSISNIDVDKNMRIYIDSIGLLDIILQITCYTASIGISLYLLAIQCKELGSELAAETNKQKETMDEIIDKAKNKDDIDGKGNEL